jgi:hypothetical protein
MVRSASANFDGRRKESGDHYHHERNHQGLEIG